MGFMVLIVQVFQCGPKVNVLDFFLNFFQPPVYISSTCATSHAYTLQACNFNSISGM